MKSDIRNLWDNRCRNCNIPIFHIIPAFCEKCWEEAKRTWFGMKESLRYK